MRDQTRPSFRSMGRWLLLGVFILQYLLMDRAIGPVPRSFFWQTLLNTGALALLLTRLKGPLQRTLWIWVLLGLFLESYFVQTAWFALKYNDPLYINQNFPELRFVNPQRLINSYGWITLAFVTLCLAASVALTWTPVTVQAKGSATPRRVLRGQTMHLVVGVSVAYLGFALLRASLGLGVLGTTGGSLPFHMQSALTFFQRNAAPALLVLAIWTLDERSPGLANVTAGVLAVASLVDAFTSTSRGSFLILTAPAFLLWVVTKRMNRKRYVAAIGGLVCAVLLFPVLSSLRQVKLGYQSSTESPPLSIDATVQSAIFIVSRIGANGADAVWHAYDHRGNLSLGRTTTLLRPNAMTRFYTQSVAHVALANDFRTPSHVGALMILGGVPAVVLGTVLLIFFMERIWNRLRYLSCWPVALALGAVSLPFFIITGAFDFLLLFKLAIVVGICELTYRRVLTRPVESRISPETTPRASSVLASQ